METSERKYETHSPSLSIVVPVYNEVATISQVVERLQKIFKDKTFEILLIDDGSTDGTTEVLHTLETEQIRTLLHAKNLGKGAALQTGFRECRGGIIVIQDADLEYDPKDIPRLIQPIRDGKADVVFGSRFHGEEQRVHLFCHRIGNAALTFLSNLMTNLNLSDMECGYKAFRREVLESFEIKESRFGIEPEITAKVAKRGYRIYEVPISYAGRDYSEGKKIGWKDALRALWCIVRYRFAD